MATSQETKSDINIEAQAARQLKQAPSWLWSGFPAADAKRKPGPVHRHVSTGPHGQLLGESPVPSTRARTKGLLRTFMITILIFRNPIFQSNVLIFRTETPVFLLVNLCSFFTEFET